MAETGLPLGAVFSGATATSLEEIRKNAEASPEGYTPSAFDPSTCSKKGYCTVARDRVPPGKNKHPSPDAISKGARVPRRKDDNGRVWRGFDMYYEVHGEGPRKVAFVMGLNNSCFGWLNQVEHFVKDPEYSCVVFDNRGYGNSEIPAANYKTSEMALDTLELFDYLGWTKVRQIHLVGISMGGMISLEIAKAAPERITSLNLISTTSGRGNGEKHLSVSLPPWVGISTLSRLIAGRTLGFDSDEYRVNAVCEMLFPPSWLEQRSEEGKGKTNREDMQEMFAFRFGFTRRQTLFGAMAQVRAVITHRISPKQLEQINGSIPKITIITGDQDNLVNPRNSLHLANHLTKAQLIRIPNAGHAPTLQLPHVINDALACSFDEGHKAVQKGSWLARKPL